MQQTILIIEDEMPMQRILSDKLTENGFQVLQARTGEEGLQIALKQHPNLIMLDLLLPVMNGLTTMTKLREDEWGKTVPVIMLTNVSPDSNETLQAIIKYKPAYYFVKSDIKLDDIVEKINSILIPVQSPV